MVEIGNGLPADVLEFVAECRQKTYPLDAEPNFDTGNPHKWGFKFSCGGLMMLDVSHEQNGRFMGEEGVYVVSANPSLNGQAFYVLQYYGGNTELAASFPNKLVDRVQHGVIMANPTIARFGKSNVRFEDLEEDGERFLYWERGKKVDGVYKNRETLGVYVPRRGYYLPVYKGGSTLQIFNPTR